MKNSRKLLLMVAILFFAFFINGCASIFDGDTSILSIMTDPKDATVTIKGSQSGEIITKHTPCSISLNKGSDYMVSIELAGYRSENVMIRREISGWFWGNILLGGIIGMVIDYGTNNMWDHTPTVLNVDLSEQSSLPQTITIEYPMTLIMEDGTKTLKNLPITFHRLI